MLEENNVKQTAAEEEAWVVTSHNDTLIAAEFRDQHRRSQLAPEKRLMLAILQDAVACYLRSADMRIGKERQLFIEVDRWIRDRESDALFSFNNVCDTLGIDPEYLTRGLVRDDGEVEPRQLGHLRLEATSRRRPRRKRQETKIRL